MDFFLIKKTVCNLTNLVILQKYTAYVNIYVKQKVGNEVTSGEVGATEVFS